jgi:hypothetical protein
MVTRLALPVPRVVVLVRSNQINKSTRLPNDSRYEASNQNHGIRFAGRRKGHDLPAPELPYGARFAGSG